MVGGVDGGGGQGRTGCRRWTLVLCSQPDKRCEDACASESMRAHFTMTMGTSLWLHARACERGCMNARVGKEGEWGGRDLDARIRRRMGS
jgi:hypothetical protein